VKLPSTSPGVSVVNVRGRKEALLGDKVACVGAARSVNAAHTDVGENDTAQSQAALAACGGQVLLPPETVLLEAPPSAPREAD